MTGRVEGVVARARRWADLQLFRSRTTLLMGGHPQSFLGARWIALLLRACPRGRRRALALRLLGLSPHYFFRFMRPEYASMPRGRFLEAEYARNRASREALYAAVLAPRLRAEDVVLDYGCGPGFLARAIARDVAAVYAADFSEGVLACAQVLHPARNLVYVAASTEGLRKVPDAGVNVACAFAVAQHVTTEALDFILAACARKLKPGGRLLLHLALDQPWRPEEAWRSDRSEAGRFLYRYALHCFARPRSFYISAVARHGFRVDGVVPVAEFCAERFDDICDEHLLIAVRTQESGEGPRLT